MRFWENEGNPMSDGRYCLVIDPEDGTQAMRTYGRTKDEVLDKVARTAETAQQWINQTRRQTAREASSGMAPSLTPQAAPSKSPQPSSEEIMQATLDLNNPGKAPAAIETLLKAGGFDVQREKSKADLERFEQIATAWEARTTDFPSDPRNQRILVDKALMMAGGKLANVTAEILDRSFREMLELGLVFDTSDTTPLPTPPMPPDGSSVPVSRPRATSVRRTTLNGAPPPPPKPQPQKYTRADIRAMNSSTLREKIKNESGFSEIVESLSRPTTE